MCAGWQVARVQPLSSRSYDNTLHKCTQVVSVKSIPGEVAGNPLAHLLGSPTKGFPRVTIPPCRNPHPDLLLLLAQVRASGVATFSDHPGVLIRSSVLCHASLVEQLSNDGC